MRKRKLDREKLLNILNAETAAPAEREVARKLLAAMDAEGISNQRTVSAKESWEVALLESILKRRKLMVSKSGMDGWITIDGEAEEIRATMMDIERLFPALESIIISATAGFLSANFPDLMESGSDADVEDDVQAAARKRSSEIKRPVAQIAKDRSVEPKMISKTKRWF